MIGICHANQDLDKIPFSINLPAIKEQAACSPVETNVSYSEREKFLLIFSDLFIKSFVTPLIADEITIT